jgi:beta-galactosidase
MKNFFIVLLLSSTTFVYADDKVDFFDYARFASAWLTTLGSPDFNEIYDLDNDNDIDIADLDLFVEDWLKSPHYLPPQTGRKKLSFNTGWKCYKGTISGDAAQSPSYDDSSWLAVNIPHNPPISGQSGPDPLRPGWPNYSYEGVSWYRKHFTLDNSYEGRKISIEFEAINTRADVWVNGTLIPTTPHYGGYLPFTVDMTNYVNFGGADNVIAVKADNTDDTSTPIGNSGWFNWGGIYRDARLHITDKLHVTDAVDANIVAGGGIFVTYPSVTTALAQVQVKTHIKNEYPTDENCKVGSYIVNDNNIVIAQMANTQGISAGGNYTFTQLIELNDPCLWHPDHPYLYTVYTEVYDNNSPVDTYQTRIGIRSISFSKAAGFKINGQALRFRGTNRLQDYPYIGYAMGNLGQRRDAEKLKEAGFEFVRTSHYPQDPAFMEACDELGIMIMDEIPGFQYFGGTTFRNRSYQNMRDMIRRDRNHPCVIAWELSLNETGFNSTYASQAMSIGHAEYPGDQCFVAGWKFGWPSEPVIYDIFIATPSAGARTYNGVLPLIIDEYGHYEYQQAGNYYSDVHRGDVGDYYYGESAMLNQIANHQDGLNLNRGMTYLCGDGLWVGIDYGPYPSGVLDPFRLPKFSYYFFQSQRDPNVIIPGVDSGPMVHIANYWTASSPTTVKVFSNCEQVKLYKNNVLQDTRSPDTGTNLQHPPFTFTGLTYTSGELKAEGLIGGQVVATHVVRTPGSATALSVAFDVNNVPANGSETIAVNASIVDSNGTLVPTASSTNVTFTVTGPATLASPAAITSEAGIATAYIRVTDQPGLITVTAAASGLASDDAAITSE